MCWVMPFTAGDDDPLFLQVKEARVSVLEAYSGKSRFPNQGQRIVDGRRLMQPASDIFLGWSVGPKRDFSVAYADQNESDHAALARGVKDGTVQAVFKANR